MSGQIKWSKQNSLSEDTKTHALLNHPDYTSDFELVTDASDCGIRAMLSQFSKPIGMFSKKLESRNKLLHK